MIFSAYKLHKHRLVFAGVFSQVYPQVALNGCRQNFFCPNFASTSTKSLKTPLYKGNLSGGRGLFLFHFSSTICFKSVTYRQTLSL